MKKKQASITASAVVSVKNTKNPDYVQMTISWSDQELPFTSYPLRTKYTQDWLTAGDYVLDLKVQHYTGKLYDVTLSNVQKLSIVERLKLVKELQS